MTRLRCLNIILIIILVFNIFTTISTQNDKIQTNSISNPHKKQNYEKVIIKKQFDMLEMQYYTKKSILPSSLINLLHQMKFQRIQVNMGFKIPQNKRITENHTNNFYIHKGISMLIKNNSQLTQKQFQTLSSIFSISKDNSFMIYFEQNKHIYTSNPNDKFCSQHLNSIIQTFLPCGTVSGVGSLINQKTILLNKKFFTIRLVIQKLNNDENQNFKINVKFILPSNSIKQLQKFAQKSQSKRSKCEYFDFSQVELKNQNEIQTQQNIKNIDIINLELEQSFIKSNWYSRQKQLISKVDIKNLLYHFNKFKRYEQLQQLTLRYLLPFGFKITKITSNMNIQHIQIQQKPQQQKQSHIYQTLILITFLFNDTISQNSIYQQNNIIVNLQYQSYLKGFQLYENIAGGGQQFMNIPLTIKLISNHLNEQQNSYHHHVLVRSNKNQISDRLLQPDFSIPFHTITFTLVIIAYLWISIWKAFYKQLKQQSY